MTDVLAALAVLTDIDCPERAAALDAFYRRWESDPLVTDKWFCAAGALVTAGTVEAVRALAQPPAFNRANPNRVRALIGAFTQGNQLAISTPRAARVMRCSPNEVLRRSTPVTRPWRRASCSRSGNGGATTQRGRA